MVKVMGRFKIKNIALSGVETHRTGVNDIEYVEIGGQARLYTTSGPDGGILAYDPETLTLVGTYNFESESYLSRPIEMFRSTLNGQDVFYVYGRYESGLSAYSILPDGRLESSPAPSAGVNKAMLTALGIVPDTGGDIFISANSSSGGLTSWRANDAGNLQKLSEVAVGTTNRPNDIYHIENVTVNDATYVLAVSGSTGSVLSFSVDSGGQFDLMGRVGSEAGLSLGYPAVVTAAQTSNATWIIAGGQGTSSLAVMRLDASGGLSVTDEVYDDRNTRFKNVMVLDSVVINDRVFIVAGGGDDGLSLMTVLPNGRLLHMESIADTLGIPLTDPTALTMTVSNDAIQLYVVGRDDDARGLSGVTHFEIQIDSLSTSVTAQTSPSSSSIVTGRKGAVQDVVTVAPPSTTVGEALIISDDATVLHGTEGADQLLGKADGDTLYGGAGDDVLIDTPGLDVFYGGAGADVFVMGPADGQTDVIRDFEIGVDRIDLNDMGRAYSKGALWIQRHGNGATINVGDEKLRVYAKDGRRLTAEDFQDHDLFDLQHSYQAEVPIEDQIIVGTISDNTLSGAQGDDTLVGGGGKDVLYGDDGVDLLIAEAQDKSFDAAAAQIYRLYIATLGRKPDLAGHLHWTETLMTNTMSVTDIAGGFTNSREFTNTYGATSSIDFVTLLYKNVLNRAPDSAGLSFWVNALDSGRMSRQKIVTGFSESTEFRTGTAVETLAYSRAGHQSKWLDDVFRLYQATLSRAPDKAGLSHWTEKLAHGRTFESVVNGFVASAEFQRKYGDLNDEMFVTLLYANVLNRAPDSGGLQTWTQVLTQGGERAFVVKGFSQSQEFINATWDNVIQWARTIGADDVLNGGSGQGNVLMGGQLSDTFVFNAKDAQTTFVADFEPWDRIDLTSFGFASVDVARSCITNQDGDAVFVCGNVSFTLLNTDIRTLDDETFLL